GADGDGDRLRDLVPRRPELQRLLDVALQAALALGGEAGRDGDELLGLAVEDRGLVRLLVELEIDLTEARLDHGVGGRLLGRARSAVVLLRERDVVGLLFLAHRGLLQLGRPDASRVAGPAAASRSSSATALS